ncbi:hypothetical protein CN234_36270 [Sinorhizobium meliloti]|nr:hypothetical protein CN234_36270 [Sinorhizobium meliloti]
MKRSKFTEEQIISILREQEAGAKTAELCRKHGMSEATFYGLEGQVRRHGCFRCEAAEGLGGRECQAEAALGGGDAGSGGVEGPFVPKVVTPVARREGHRDPHGCP